MYKLGTRRIYQNYHCTTYFTGSTIVSRVPCRPMPPRPPLLAVLHSRVPTPLYIVSCSLASRVLASRCKTNCTTMAPVRSAIAILLLQTTATAGLATKAVRPIIIAPAQFGVPRDYDTLSKQLEARGHKVFVVPLTRLSW